MSNNHDVVLSQLASEINNLDAKRKSGNTSKIIEMGHKLIAVRVILRELYGGARGSLDATGNPAPNGWVRWVEDNLTIGRRHAASCIKMAVDPEAEQIRRRAIASRASYTPTGAIQRARKAWPNWSQADRDKFCQGVLTLMDAA